VSVIAQDGEGRLLLIRNSYGAGSWSFLGGGIGRGEAPERAAARELREETGLTPASLRLLASFEEPVLNTSSTAFLFTASVDGQPLTDGREIAEARFFAPHRLPTPLDRQARARLALYERDRADPS
jgi:ADP-ribose pyrophosphatase YjhB (NUDIX family)